MLGIRYTGGTVTTIPALASLSPPGGLIAHLASGAGWQTTFALVKYRDDHTERYAELFRRWRQRTSVAIDFSGDRYDNKFIDGRGNPRTPGLGVDPECGADFEQPLDWIGAAHYNREHQRLCHFPLQSQRPGSSRAG